MGGNFEIQPHECYFSASTREIMQYRTDDAVKGMFGKEYEFFQKGEILQAKQFDFLLNKVSKLGNLDMNDPATVRYLSGAGKSIDQLDKIDLTLISLGKKVMNNDVDANRLMKVSENHPRLSNFAKANSRNFAHIMGAYNLITFIRDGRQAYDEGGIEALAKFTTKEGLGFLATEAFAPYCVAIGCMVGGPIGGFIGGLVAGYIGYKVADLIVDSIWDVFEEGSTISSPIILDLDGNGVKTTNDIDNPHFDLDANGFAEKTGWVDKNDGLLVYDRNGDGIINNGTELFGDNTILSNGQKAKNGFEALAELDDNHDGKIDANDKAYSKLRLWIDKNSDAITDEKELITLEEAGIKSLSTSNVHRNQKQENGNIKYLEGTYEKQDGTKHEMTDYYFVTNMSDTIARDIMEETQDVKKLPDINGMGNVYSLHQAMMRDETIKNLVMQYVKEENKQKRLEILDIIILKWTCTENEDKNTAGEHVDYRKLKAMEKLVGTPFKNYSWGSVVGSDQGKFFNESYQKLTRQIDAMLQLQVNFEKTVKYVPFVLDSENGKLAIDNSKFLLEIKQAYGQKDKTKYNVIKSFINNLHDSKSQAEYYLQFQKYIFLKDMELAKEIYSSHVVQGTEKNDSISVNNKNILDFSIVSGGKGNDTIYGRKGKDVYFFNLGDGTDTIYESNDKKDSNSIVFGKGIRKEDIVVKRLNQTDISLSIRETQDKIILKNQINQNPSINKVYFEDGEELDYKEMANIANQITTGDDFIETTNDNDEIDLLSGDDTVYTKSGQDTIHGNAGADTIYAGEGDDILYGDEGSDKLYGENGEDTLIGGTGDDYLNGGYGADTYLFHKGDGIDTIEEYDYNTQNIDKIQLDKDIKKEDIILNRKGNDLEITFKAGNDKIIVKNQFANANSTIEQIVYGNNQIIAFQEMLDTTNRNSQKEHLLQGAYTDDILVGSQESDTIHGYDGQDQITGGKGDDSLDGGYGNDTYYYNKGDGSDIITDYSGNNTLILGEGISKDKVVFTRVSREDIVMSIVGTEDKITIKNQWNNRTIDKVQFHDGSSLTYDQIKSIVNTPTDRDDYLEGTNGADILEGGKGNDYLNGGYGADTYIFSRGDGQDTIEDYSGGYEGIDKLIFKDINREDVIFSRESENDITILVKNSNDKIKIKYGNTSYRAIEEIHFANGEVMTYEEMMKQPFEYYGDEQDNTIKTYSTDDKIFAGAGDDTINAGDGNNTVYGQDGDDKIYTGSGADILEGGKGNDYLNGGYGGDTYVFSRGDGQDTIEDYSGGYEGVDKLIFKDINREDVIFSRESENDITILVKNSNDKIKIKYGNTSYRAIEEIHFANGEVMTYEEMMKQPFEYYGDEQDNTIKTYSTDDKIFAGAGDDTINAGDGNNIVYGGEGNDEIRSGRGNDTLVGGKGNDYLNGGYGNDTYVFRQGYGNDTIFDENGSQDKVITASDMLHTIFEKDGNDMRMTIAGREDSVTVKNWYSSDSYKIEEFHGEEKSMITSRQIDLLIQAMASFSQEKGISWSKAIEERPTEVEAVVQNFWAKQM